MASIVERNGRFMAKVRIKGFAAVTKTFSRKSDATAWARGVEAGMATGRWVPPDKTVPTLAKAIDQYKVSIAGRLKGATDYGYVLNAIAADPMASKPIDTVTPADLSSWRDTMLSAGLKANTVARRLGLLSGLLTWAVQDKCWLASNPMRQVRKPRCNDARDRVATADELQYLQAAAASSRAEWLPDTLVVLLQSAMRRGELWGLAAADIDYGAAVAHLSDTKNGCARDVPLSPEALAALRRLDESAKARAAALAAKLAKRAVVRESDKAALVTVGRLVPVSEPHAVSLAFRRTLARARRCYEGDCKARGVSADSGFLVGLRLHDTRHHAITTWAATGALSVHELQQVSGHRTTAMLSRYVNLSASALALKLARVSNQSTTEATA